jgi:3-polyprenyl-4-hydroxybenzoate decarboxylase
MKLILGVTGSVAAKLTPKLVKAILSGIVDVEIKIVVTERGHYFFMDHDVDRRALPILTDRYEWPAGGYAKGNPVPHIDLGEWADRLVIAPLTADTLSDMAHGKADKFLTSIVLAWPREKPLFIAPAMNTRMWENEITQANLRTVMNTYGASVIPPKEGELACGVRGVGAMADIDNIVAAISR